MGGIKLKIHPLFYLFLIVELAVGNAFVFVVYAITAVIHEVGHSFSASKRGYYLNKIVLTPFGALVSGSSEFDLKDQVSIALAGPLVNLLIGAVVMSLWWIIPETYAYTDVIVIANFSMAIVNLMPCYPLDGGRVLSALFSKKFGEDKAHKITKTLGVMLSLVFFIVFIITLKSAPNLSAFMMGTFTLVGALSMKKENRYVKIYTAISTEKLLRGMAYNKIAIDINATIKTLFLSLDQNVINEVVVFSEGEVFKVLYQKDINALLEKGAFKEKISKYL